MERWQRYLIVGLASLVGAFAIFSVGFATGQRGQIGGFLSGNAQAGSDGASAIDDALGRILSTAVDPPTEAALTRGAIKGMIDVLKKADDPYALFFSPKGFKSLQELTSGKFSGIGVWLKEKNKELHIVSVLPDTPALEAGLQRGDVILEIDGTAVSEMNPDEAVSLIKGPEGSEVRLGIERTGQSLDFAITREAIELPNLQARLTTENLGYARLFGFARDAGKQVRAEVKDLIDQGAEGMILDLRDNGGGLFDEGVNVASVFIEDGRVVTYQDGQDEKINYEAEGDAFEDVPLVVLVNEGTASASEIVAGALQDRDRAVLIGTTTYGKGSVQEIIPLPDASAVKFTTAAYLTPDGRNINGKGISPDVEVDAAPDVQFDRAVEVLQGIVLSGSGSPG
ncbi:MAG: S41 family peptidase [Actinomycetota bacterium]